MQAEDRNGGIDADFSTRKRSIPLTINRCQRVSLAPSVFLRSDHKKKEEAQTDQRLIEGVGKTGIGSWLQ